MELMRSHQFGDQGSESFPVLVLTSKGLEGVCFDEVSELSCREESGRTASTQRVPFELSESGTPVVSDVELCHDGVRCRANLAGIIFLNLHLRTASRVLIRLVDGLRVKRREEISAAVQSLAIPERWMDVSKSFRIDSTCKGVTWVNQKYLAMVVKDAVCDAFRNTHHGKRPSVDKDEPDVRIYVKLENERLFLSLDTSGRALHERGYRGHTDHEAPMREHLAAGLLRLAGWADFCRHINQGKQSCYRWSRVTGPETAREPPQLGRRIPSEVPFSGGFLDPMCGSGTLVIEAARMLMALPLKRSWNELGVSRLRCGLRKQHVFDSVLADAKQMSVSGQAAAHRLKTYQARNSAHFDGLRPIGVLSGSDLSADCVREARENAERAGVSALTTFQTGDFRQVSPNCRGTLAVINPPYDRRLGAPFHNGYRQFGDTFKQQYAGSVAWLISADLENLKNLGLRPTRKHTVFNGQLETRFCQYVIYPGAAARASGVKHSGSLS